MRGKLVKKQKNTFVTPIDYSKAFDSVDRGEMINIMKEYKFNEKIIEVRAKIYQGMIEEIEITSGIRQGCTSSALLLNVVTYEI